MEEVHELRPVAAERLPLLNKLVAGIHQHGMLATPPLQRRLGLMLLGALGLLQTPATGEQTMRWLPTATQSGTLCRPAGARLALHVPQRSLVDCNIPYC